MNNNSPTNTGTALGNRRGRLRFLILAAAILHVAVAAAVFTAGKSQLMPSQFAPSGLAAFASDGYVYQNEAVELCDVLKSQGLAAWAVWPTQLHVRLYSLPLAALNGGTSFNILAIEPLNLIYYLAILVLVFKLGELVFDYRTGLLATAIVALWPSFLLHTTQLLRDPLLISSFLVLMLSVTLCLKREYAWHRGILLGVAGTAAIVLIRIVRLPMWPMLLAIVALVVLSLVIRLIRLRRFPFGNVAFAVMMIAAIMITPRFQNAFHNQQFVKKPRIIVSEEVQALPVSEQIAARRQGFVDSSGAPVPSEAGSDIDTGVRFKSVADIIRHLPRAAVVGFLAPFPNMWLSAGRQAGAIGRIVSGFEMILTYMIECLALFGLWSRRKHLAAWLLFVVAALGALSLGLIVTNIGALYRLRYPFWALLVVLGAGGADYLLRRKAVRTSPPLRPATTQPTGTIPS